MKKAIQIAFILLYAVVTFGVTVSVHFCGTVKTSAEVIPFNSDAKSCGCDNESTNDFCCRTEIYSNQLNTESVAAHTVELTLFQTVEAILPEVTIDFASSHHADNFPVSTVSPPGSPPLFILQRSLLI